MHAPESLPTDPDPVERRRRELRQIRSGCSGCLVALIAIALFIGGFTGLQHWLRASTFGDSSTNLIMMGRPEKHADAMLWIGAFTSMVMLFAFSARSMKWGVGLAALVAALGATTVVFTCYREFMAIRPLPGSEAELVFLWPRPAAKIDARGATVREEDEILQIGDVPTSVYYLVIEVGGATYRSSSSGSVDNAKRFLAARGARFVH
jgi:hypothetical protein